MADHSNPNSLFRKVFFPYIKRNFLITGIVGYYFIGLILYVFAKIDILIPCIWHSLFDIRCPGCGLTRAFIDLISFNYTAAWDSNPLIFIVFPGITYYIIKDFVRFVKNNS